MKWNESGFRPPLCTYRLNWARRTSWGWWDDTVLQTQDSKFGPWGSEAEHATSRSRRLPTILTFTRGWEETFFVSFKPPSPGTEPRTLAWKAAVITSTLGLPPIWWWAYFNHTQQSQCVHSVFCWYWASVADCAPTLIQQCDNVYLLYVDWMMIHVAFCILIVVISRQKEVSHQDYSGNRLTKTGKTWSILTLNPLSPHDALKHNFTSLKTDLIFLQQRVLEREFPWNWFTNTWQFSSIFKPHEKHLHPLQVENCDSNSRLVVDEDDNGKLRLERVKALKYIYINQMFVFSI